MTDSFDAVATVEIKAPAAAVWNALVDPAMIAQYLHGAEVATDWKVGSPITWSGEWQGKAYEDKGEVLEVDPLRRLRVTHWSPLTGAEDLPENYHTVTYDLDESGDTTTLTLTQSNNPSQEAADQMAEANWGPVLEGLKAAVER